jgi:hypothetical protein
MSIETVEFSLITVEDLDIGTGTRAVALADGSTPTLHQVSLASLAILKTERIVASNNAPVLTLTGFIPAGARVMGVTYRVLTAFGTGNGLTGLHVGDAIVDSRWIEDGPITLNAVADEASPAYRGSGAWPLYVSGGNVIITGVGGLFTGAGELEATLHYFSLRHRTAA